MKLYVCYSTTTLNGHPCGVAHKALVDAGHDPTSSARLGWRLLPDFPFNQTPGRREVKRLTGDSTVPTLILDDGEVVDGSQAIVDWARAHPA